MSENGQALIVVDVQNDFLPGGSLAVPDGDQVIPVINQLMERFGIIVATQDWHPANHGSFASNRERGNIGDLSELGGLPQILWPDHCVQGTAGAEFSRTLNSDKFTHVVRKGTNADIDSYSGFFDNGRRQATELESLLRQHSVDQVTVVGLATDYCVKFTALDAVSLGFETRLRRDACRGVNLSAGDVDKAIEEMQAAGVVVD